MLPIMTLWVGGCLYLQANDLAKLLDDAEKAPSGEARFLLRHAFRVLDKAPNRMVLAVRLGKVVEQKVQTPAELAEVLGPGIARTITRQGLFRRYIEVWSIEHPARIVVQFDCPRGLEPRMRSVTVLQ